tara:strand:+ start:487 stop:747 length:261 start_codon:yes stop_codon:yes gene_type:complete
LLCSEVRISEVFVRKARADSMDADDCSHRSFLALSAQVPKSGVKIEDIGKLVEGEGEGTQLYRRFCVAKDLMQRRKVVHQFTGRAP